jgi:hypothetical protein
MIGPLAGWTRKARSGMGFVALLLQYCNYGQEKRLTARVVTCELQ